MRIGFLIDRWQPRRGGAENAMAQLATHLASRGHEVMAFGARGPRPGEEAPGTFHAVGGGLHFAGWSRGARERALGRALVDAARASGCERTIGVRHLPQVDVLWSQEGSQRAGLPTPTPARGRRKAFVEMERELLTRRSVKHVVCVSDMVRAEYERWYPEITDLLVTIANGVDTQRFHPRERAESGAALRSELGLASGEPLIVFAGHDPQRKGLPELLAALAQLPAKPWRLLIAGPKQPGRWLRAARRVGIEGARVFAREHVDSVALAAGADLCVLPTWRDACGLVVLEALACGTPVITTRLAGAAEVVRDAHAGLVLDHPGDRAGLTAAIEDALERIAGGVDRERVRCAVLERDATSWLMAMESLVLGREATGASPE